MKAINPFSSMAAGANTFFAAIESDIQSGVKNADGDGQVGTTIEALATEREAPATSAEADDVEVGASGAADYELRERLAAAQQQCKKLEQRLAEKAELCGDKDSQLAGVLEEGEQLSKRQAELEKVIRELKQGLREAVAVGDNAKAELEAARQQREDAARQHKEKATSSDGAREEAGRTPAPSPDPSPSPNPDPNPDPDPNPNQVRGRRRWPRRRAGRRALRSCCRPIGARWSHCARSTARCRRRRSGCRPRARRAARARRRRRTAWPSCR